MEMTRIFPGMELQFMLSRDIVDDGEIVGLARVGRSV